MIGQRGVGEHGSVTMRKAEPLDAAVRHAEMICAKETGEVHEPLAISWGRLILSLPTETGLAFRGSPGDCEKLRTNSQGCSEDADKTIWARQLRSPFILQHDPEI